MTLQNELVAHETVVGDDIITAAELEARGADAPTDETLVFETSGTNGEPKRIPYAYSQLPAQKRHEAQAFELAGLRPDDVVMTLAAPLNGISGWASRSGSRELGAEVLNRSFKDYTHIIEWQEAAEVTALFATPLVAQSIGEEIAAEYGPPRELFPNLRLGCLFGDHLPPHLRTQLRQQWGFEELRSLYGSVEADVLAVGTDETQQLVPMLDKLVFEVIPDDDETETPVDIRKLTRQRTGSLLVSDPHRDAFPFTRYRIGDIVTVLPEGNEIPRLRVLGREDDTINFGGAPLYEQQLQATIEETYGTAIDDWTAVVSRPELKPAVDIYVAGGGPADESTFRTNLFAQSPPLKEAFGEVGDGVIEYMRVHRVDSVPNAVDDVDTDEINRDLKTNRIVFEDSYREYQLESASH
jgi:phenylacetate-coenzyme A ligase PaaK-like adenylate-forming protein